MAFAGLAHCALACPTTPRSKTDNIPKKTTQEFFDVNLLNISASFIKVTINLRRFDYAGPERQFMNCVLISLFVSPMFSFIWASKRSDLSQTVTCTLSAEAELLPIHESSQIGAH
jgi:hypothetical protein